VTRAFADEDFEACLVCPWCGAREAASWGAPLRGFEARCCGACDVVYLSRRLTPAAQEAYYARYLSEEHEADAELNTARARMYELEFELIAPHVPSVVAPKGAKPRVLDVGCSRGGFLEVFARHGFACSGVEFGAEAAAAAAQRFDVQRGELPELDLRGPFDLVTFRGVIEHVQDPQRYLRCAFELLAPGGALFVTSTPNRDAFCCELFGERWNQHEPEGHLFHLATRHLDALLVEQLGATKLFERYLYESTPYADPSRDLARVAEAQASRARGEAAPFDSPPFWGNMLSVAYRK